MNWRSAFVVLVTSVALIQPAQGAPAPTTRSAWGPIAPEVPLDSLDGVSLRGVVALPTGWVAYYNEGSSNDEFVRRLDAAGVPVEVLPGPYPIKVVVTPDGRRVHLWAELPDTSGNRAYRVALFAADGQRKDVDTLIRTKGPVDVAVRPDGSFALAWKESLSAPPFSAVALRLYDAEGVPLAGPRLLSSTQLYDLDRALVGSDAAGNLVVVWGALDGIYFVLVDDAGQADEPQLIAGTAVQPNPFWGRSLHIAVSRDGAFVIGSLNIIQDPPSSTRKPTLRWHRFDRHGEQLFEVAIPNSGVARPPQVVLQSDGVLVGTWSVDNIGWQVVRYTQHGDALGTPTPLQGDTYGPFLAVDGDDRTLVLWNRTVPPCCPYLQSVVVRVFGADRDQDQVTDSDDNCPISANSGQLDADGDGVGDACDNCPSIWNSTQQDSNRDRVGDACGPRGPLECTDCREREDF